MSKPTERISALEFRRKYLGKVSKDKTSLNDLSVMDAPKANKYHNKRCEYIGMKFDSIREMNRYIYLESCQKRGSISNLQRQVWITLIPDEYADFPQQLKTKVKMVRRRTFIGVRYKADFVYEKDGQTIYEDVKSTINKKKMQEGAVDDVFVIKYKMLHHFLHIDLKLVESPTDPV